MDRMLVAVMKLCMLIPHRTPAARNFDGCTVRIPLMRNGPVFSSRVIREVRKLASLPQDVVKVPSVLFSKLRHFAHSHILTAIGC